MPRSKIKLDGISAVILDMDGVIYTGNAPVRGAREAVRWLREKGKKVIFSTNNSSGTRAEYVKKLNQIGIPAQESEIVTAGYATAVYLRKRAPDAIIYAVGEGGLRSELRSAGLKIVGDDEARRATHVVTGLDRKLNYDKIAAGLRALLAGAEFIATNTDSTYPTERGLTPGAGATVGALSGCSGREPDLVVGKPSLHMIKISLGLLGARPEETLMIGDRIDTDVKAGKAAGVRTALVLSGVYKARDLMKAKKGGIAPDFVLRSIAEVMN